MKKNIITTLIMLIGLLKKLAPLVVPIYELLKPFIRAPYSWMPEKWKGYRIVGISVAVAVLAFFQAFDWFTLEAAINQIGQLFNPNFLIDIPEELLVTWIGFALAELRNETNAPYGQCSTGDCTIPLGI